MFLAPMVIRANDTTLDDTEESFRRIRVDALSPGSANVLPTAMVDLVMGSEMLSDLKRSIALHPLLGPG